MLRNVLLIFMLFLSTTGSQANGVVCNQADYPIAIIDGIREDFISDNYKSLMEIIDFPIKKQTSGVIRPVKESTFPYKWKNLATKKVKLIVEKASHCKLVEIFGLKKNWLGKIKITQIIFYTDKEDLKYTFSGFISAKESFGFIKKINQLVEKKNYTELSKYIDFPAFDINKHKYVNQADFLKYVDRIMTEKVKNLLKNAEDGSNFTEHNEGIMLNSRGDVWIASYVNKGILIRINDPSSR